MSANPAIKNLLYKETEVGKTIKSTKVLFAWEFYLDEKPHRIELYDSRLSGKRKLLRNGQLIKEVVQDTTFIKTFEINTHSVTIIQHGEKYELRIDNQSFSHMMDLERNKNHFGGSTHTTASASTSTFNNQNNFKLGAGKPAPNFGTGIMSGQSQSKDKPALFNFAIKPANVHNPNLANRKFGAGEAQVGNGSVGVGNGNLVVQVNAGSSAGVNLLDFGEGAGAGNNANLISNNNNNSYGVNKNGNANGNNLLGDMNYANANAVNNQNANLNVNNSINNNNNNALDPFDIINSLSNVNNSGINNNNMNVNNHNSVKTNLFGVDISKPNNTDKAQNLLEAMYSTNNNQNSGFVDFSKQGNQMGMGMNQGYVNSNQYSLGMPANNTMMNNNDMMFSNMNPGNNQINLGYGMNNAVGGNNQIGYNPNPMGAQYNMNMNNNYGNNNAMNNYGYPQQQPNVNQNNYKKDLLDDLF